MPVDHAGNIPCRPTRFPSGLNNANVYETLGHMGQPDPTKYITDFEDFLLYLATDWTITTTGTGTRALTAGAGGQLLITNSAAAPDANFYQRVQPAFSLAAGKRAFFKCKFSVDDATLAALQFGLIVQDTTPLDATDGIYFLKPAGAATIQAFVRKDATTGSNTNANIGTLASATMTTFGWHYDGKSTVEFFINDILVAKLDASSTYLPDALLATSFGVGNGSAVARALTIDYVFAAQER